MENLIYWESPGITSNLAGFIEKYRYFNFCSTGINYSRQNEVWEMPDGCWRPPKRIGTCFGTIWLHQTLESRESTSKFQLWVREFVLANFPCVQESLRRSLGFWILASGSWVLDLGSWILDCELWIVNYELWIVNYELWIMNCGVWIVNWEFCIMKCVLWIMDCYFTRTPFARSNPAFRFRFPPLQPGHAAWPRLAFRGFPDSNLGKFFCAYPCARWLIHGTRYLVLGW